MLLILENLAFAFLSCTWVPSPQSIRKCRSSISKICAVGEELTVGMAELKPNIVSLVLKICNVFLFSYDF